MTTAPARPSAATRPLPADIRPTYPIRIALSKTGQKVPLVQQLQSVLYLREIAPDRRGARAVRTFRSPAFTLALDLHEGGHRLSFTSGLARGVEVVSEDDAGLPAGAVAGCLCAGDNEAEHEWLTEPTPTNPGRAVRVSWMTSVQTEQLPEHLFADTLSEMDEVIRAGAALTHRWQDGRGECLSVLDVQRSPTEAHVQAYHLVATGGVVLRTQTIFEILKGDSRADGRPR